MEALIQAIYNIMDSEKYRGHGRLNEDEVGPLIGCEESYCSIIRVTLEYALQINEII